MEVISKGNIGRLAVMFLLACGLDVTGQTSVLATGDWWQLKVETEGVYRVGTADIPALAGVQISSIAVYGASGEMLSTDNRLTSTADLQPIPIDVMDADGNGVMDAGDYILFYGEGTDVWRYDNGDARWEMHRHAYASANFYYLTTSSSETKRPVRTASLNTSATIGDYTAVTAVNNDLTNIFSSGQVWVGEKFTPAIGDRTFTLTLPAEASNIKLRYAFAFRGSLPGYFHISTTGLSTSHYLNPNTVYYTCLEAIGSSVRNLAVNVAFAPGESTAEGWLDYIEMTGRVPLRFSGSQVVARFGPDDAASALYVVSGTSGMRVWEVTSPFAVREMTVLQSPTSGQVSQWSDTMGGARRYAIFSNSNLRSVANVSPVVNQNLHGSPQSDYIIVCNKLFRIQAQRVAALHAVMDNVSTLVVSDDEVYREFSSGKQDPMAIRAFLRHMRNSYPDAPPRWVLLFGKASYDARDLARLGLPTVVTYETPDSFHDESDISHCSDDMMGYLHTDEVGTPSQSLDVAIGRLPAKNTAEADHMVDKIEGYMTRRDLSNGARGDWRNYVALLADDADPSRIDDTRFAISSEYTACRIKELFPAINIDRLYADAYRQQSGAIGSYYPDLNNALRQRINYGCLLLNYIGHGSQKYIGTERYIEPSDISAYTNVDRPPLFVTSTCTYGRHDMPDDLCGAEMCLLADGAAIAVISASRPITHDSSFNTNLVLYALDRNNTIGDALRIAKNHRAVSSSIGLLGDPALHLSVPQNEIIVTYIDGHPVQDGIDDTATVLSTVTVRGQVHDADGTLHSGFNGYIYPVVFDRETQAHTLANDNPGTQVPFMQQKNILYKGIEKVSDGTFEYSFTVPRDVQYQYGYGKLSHYAVSGTEDASGSYSHLLFGGLNENVTITEVRPQIRLFIGDTNFRNGGLACQNPTLVALLTDSVGINAFGSGLGHDIAATIDGNAGSLVVLNDFYQPDISDPRGGQVLYTFSDIAPGMHTLTLKAWNIYGYSNQSSINFCVHPDSSPSVSKLTASPNPASEYVELHCQVSNNSAVTSALLQIYTSQGVPVRTFVPVATGDSQVLGPVRWDLADVPPGIYLARITVSVGTATHSSTAKIIVR